MGPMAGSCWSKALLLNANTLVLSSWLELLDEGVPLLFCAYSRLRPRVKGVKGHN